MPEINSYESESWPRKAKENKCKIEKLQGLKTSILRIQLWSYLRYA